MAAPPDVYGALVTYTRAAVSVDVYLNREPETQTTTTRVPPYVEIEGKFSTEWSFEAEYTDCGEVIFKCFAVGDDNARTLGEQIKTLFVQPSSWSSIPIVNKKFVEVSRTGYELYTEDELNQDGNVIYRYEVNFHVVVEGNS